MEYCAPKHGYTVKLVFSTKVEIAKFYTLKNWHKILEEVN